MVNTTGLFDLRMNGPFHNFFEFPSSVFGLYRLVWFDYTVDTVIVVLSHVSVPLLYNPSQMTDHYLYVYEYPRKDQR